MRPPSHDCDGGHATWRQARNPSLRVSRGVLVGFIPTMTAVSPVAATQPQLSPRKDVSRFRVSLEGRRRLSCRHVFQHPVSLLWRVGRRPSFFPSGASGFLRRDRPSIFPLGARGFAMGRAEGRVFLWVRGGTDRRALIPPGLIYTFYSCSSTGRSTRQRFVVYSSRSLGALPPRGAQAGGFVSPSSGTTCPRVSASLITFRGPLRGSWLPARGRPCERGWM